MPDFHLAAQLVLAGFALGILTTVAVMLLPWAPWRRRQVGVPGLTYVHYREALANWHPNSPKPVKRADQDPPPTPPNQGGGGKK